jgi:hypothetical protein
MRAILVDEHPIKVINLPKKEMYNDKLEAKFWPKAKSSKQ